MILRDGLGDLERPAAGRDSYARFDECTVLMNAPSRVVFGPDGLRYVLDPTSVLIYRDVKSAPTFVTKVTMGLNAPVDMAIVE